MSVQEGQLLNKKGNLKGVRALVYNPDIQDWEKTNTTGWTVASRKGYRFFIGIGERDDVEGYTVEIELSRKSLNRILDTLIQKEFDGVSDKPSFSEDPHANRYDYLEGDFPT